MAEEIKEKDPMDMTDKELYSAMAKKIKHTRGEGDFRDSLFLPMIMEKMCSPEDARILLSLPTAPADLASKVGMSEEEVESRLKVLGEKALAFNTRRGWFMPRHVTQFHDGALANPKYDEEFGPEYFALWKAFYDLEYSYVEVPVLPPQERGTRIIPDRRALPEGAEPAPYEELVSLFEDMRAGAEIGLMPCSCKRGNPGDEFFDDYWACVVWQRSYEWNKARGTAKTLSSEELAKAVEDMHDNGLITMAPNAKSFASTKGAAQMFCNCYPTHCDGMRPYIMQGIPLYKRSAPSRYRMTVKSTADCQACQKCVETCIFEAAQLKYDKQSKKFKAWVDTDKCAGCGNCALKCPIQNRVLKRVREDDWVPEEVPEIMVV